MKKLVIFLSVILSACASNNMTHVTETFPEAPASLKTPCPDLAEVDPNTTKLSDALNVITTNYGQYYVCKGTVDDWIEWYNAQQKIFNSIK